MRIQTDNWFASRPLEELKEKPKYFLIYEGELTEPMYFKGIIINRDKLAINSSISLINVFRSLNELNKSHPKYALQMAKDIKNQSENNCITKENLLKSIIDFIEENSLKDKESLVSIAESYIDNYANYIIYNEEINDVIMDIYKEEIFENVSENILEYLRLQRDYLDYNPDIDIINLIVDRDSSSFKDYQYDDLLNSCKEHNIKLYVSNPCFEVWLLMHFEEFRQLDFNKLLDNKRVGNGKKSRKYSDKMLSEFSPKNIGYNKSNLKFEVFVDRIDLAIRQEKEYCEDLQGLKDNIGSNVGLLIEELR